MPRNHHPLDFAGAFVDLGDACIAVVPLDGVVGQVAVAAVDLDGVGADFLKARNSSGPLEEGLLDVKNCYNQNFYGT